MKRHLALAPLSRDHHHALVIGRRWRHADEEDADEVAQRTFWSTGRPRRGSTSASRRGFCPAYAEQGDPDHPAVVRTLLDHMVIRPDVAKIAAGASPELLHDLGTRLVDHVKLEENELFPLVERTIPEPRLRELGSGSATTARERPAAPTHGEGASPHA